MLLARAAFPENIERVEVLLARVARPEAVTHTSGLSGGLKVEVFLARVVRKIESRAVTRTSGLFEWLVSRTSFLLVRKIEGRSTFFRGCASFDDEGNLRRWR